MNVSNVSSTTVRLPTGSSTGAVLVSLTVTVIVSRSSSAGVPSSVTTTSNGYEPGPCAAVGVQVNTPDNGSIAAPAGAPERLNVSTCGGLSGSLAVAVNVSSVSSTTV